VLVLAACGGAPSTPTEQSGSSQSVPTAASGGASSAPTAASGSAQSGATPATGAQSQPAASGLPISTDGLTLSYWVETNPNITATSKTFNDISLYKEMEKRTGVHLDFQHPPTGPNQGREQFSLMVASGQYPDIIETNWLNGYYQGGPSKALKDGIIIRLNDLIDQHAPNLKKVLDEHPDWRKQVVTDEGDLYCFPFLRGDPALLVFAGPVVRQDYFDKLSLKTPTTIDEWHAALTKIKGQDLNGNGTTDEWPFSPWKDNSFRGGFNNHAFVGAWGVTTGFYQDKGTVKFGPLQPEFKEFLATMVAWYKEGLIDPDTISFDQKAYDAKMTGGTMATGVMNVGGGIGKFMGLMQEKDPNFKLVGVPYPVLKAGETPQLGQRDNVFPGNGAAITGSNKHVEESVRLLDYAYSTEGGLLFNFGVEGLSYKMVNGYPTYTDLLMHNPDGLPVAQAMAANIRGNSSGPFVQDKRYVEQYFQLPVQQDAYKIWQQPTNEKQMPPVTPSMDESRRFAKIMGDINTRFDEVFAKVLTGAQPVDSWDTFLAEMQQLGIEEATQIQQAALERYNKRA
jgi:putative aldouronate transport system substrate-binding protein